jgi:excisionase family DNA binding protein
VTVHQAADRLDVSEGTVYALCARRRLRHSRVGLGRGKISISEDAISEYLKGAEVGLAEPGPTPVSRPRVTFKHLHL